MLKSIFINKNSKLRSGFKIFLLFFSFFVLVNIFTMAIAIIYTLVQIRSHSYSEVRSMLTNPNGTINLILSISQCVSMILMVWLFTSAMEKKKIRDIGLINIKYGYKDLFKGLIFGAALLTGVFVILNFSGQVALVNPLRNPVINSSLISGIITFIFVGINEEMFARGYCMTVLKDMGGKAAVIISAVVFALMHSLNPGVSPLSYVNLFLFGVLASYMTLKSRNLWYSIGCHITWNYFEGNVYGFLVSGTTASGMYTTKNITNNLINGGSFGPEGGLVVTLILVLGILYVWKIYTPSLVDGETV